MSLSEGHALLLNLPFANGMQCNYKRPFLIIGTNTTEIDLLNVSSVKGKERKLLFPSNKKLKKYNPPFDRPSFVKMDELYTISNFVDLNQRILNGQPLESDEFGEIIEAYLVYKSKNNVIQVRYEEAEVRQGNL